VRIAIKHGTRWITIGHDGSSATRRGDFQAQDGDRISVSRVLYSRALIDGLPAKARATPLGT
jgi:hypothetical protein